MLTTSGSVSQTDVHDKLESALISANAAVNNQVVPQRQRVHLHHNSRMVQAKHNASHPSKNSRHMNSAVIRSDNTSDVTESIEVFHQPTIFKR